MPSSEPPNAGGVPPSRTPTHVPGLDEILGGGVFKGGVYIVIGQPGAGKTILASQLAFGHARAGGRVVYATLLSETHGRLLGFLRSMAFHDAALVGDAISYLNGFSAVESGGLAGLLQLIRGAVRDHRASLLVIDGMLAASSLGQSELDYKKFIQQLQTWIEVVGCTVFILTTGGEPELRPEFTMADGIFELEYARVGPRRVRQLTVTKLRGSGFYEGKHSYAIDARGVTVYPRIETSVGLHEQHSVGQVERAPFGIPALDALVGGGLARSSSTLLLGASGAGKTGLGLSFLAAGLDRGERVVHCGFNEDAPALLSAGDRLGLRLSERARDGSLVILWRPSSEILLDRVGHELLGVVRRLGANRLFVDGVEALKRSAFPDRLPSFTYALVQELRTLSVTTMLAAEANNLQLHQIDVPFPGISGVVDNLLVMKQLLAGSTLERQLAIVKTRDRGHEHGFFRYTIGERGIELPRASGVAAPPRGRDRPRGGKARKR